MFNIPPCTWLLSRVTFTLSRVHFSSFFLFGTAKIQTLFCISFGKLVCVLSSWLERSVYPSASLCTIFVPSLFRWCKQSAGLYIGLLFQQSSLIAFSLDLGSLVFVQGSKKGKKFYKSVSLHKLLKQLVQYDIFVYKLILHLVYVVNGIYDVLPDVAFGSKCARF